MGVPRSEIENNLGEEKPNPILGNKDYHIMNNLLSETVKIGLQTAVDDIP